MYQTCKLFHERRRANNCGRLFQDQDDVGNRQIKFSGDPIQHYEDILTRAETVRGGFRPHKIVSSFQKYGR